jgi:energy-coupling factor transporter ATP-binding protein EcfA2
VLNGAILLLTGVPGSGKSWLLTRLAESLRAEGHLVARHYCYIAPGDLQRDERITIDVLYGNLIAELVEAEPPLGRQQTPRYSAGPDELSQLLTAAVQRESDRRVVLIVDGLDHVERVLPEAKGVHRFKAELVHELATMPLPEGVCLVIGSQPGPHLAPLLERTSPLNLSGWDPRQTRELAQRLGLLGKLRTLGFRHELKSFAEALHDRSEGNPLYITFRRTRR